MTVDARRRVVGRVAAALLVAAVVVAGALPDRAEGSSRHQVVPGPDETRVELLSQTMWHVVGDDIDLSVRTRGAPSDALVRLELYAPVRGRGDVQRLADGDDPGPTLRIAPVLPLEELTTLSGRTDLRLEVDDGLVPGVYPLTVTIVGPSPLARLLTFVVVLDAVALGVEASNPDDGGGGEVSEPRDAQLDAPVRPLVVTPMVQMPSRLVVDATSTSVPSETLTDLEVMGSTLAAIADVTLDVVVAPAVLDQLDPVHRDRLFDVLVDDRPLVTTYVPIAADAWVAAGLVDGLERQRLAGHDAVSALLGDSFERRTWVADGGLDPRSLRVLGDLGIERFVVDPGLLTPLDDTVAVEATGRPFGLLTDDARTVPTIALEAELSERLERRDPLLAAHHVAAELAAIWFDDPEEQRGVAMRVTIRDDRLSDLLTVVRSSPILALSSLNSLFETVEPATLTTDDTTTPLVRSLSPVPVEDLAPFAGALAETDALLGAYASLSPVTSPTVDRLRQRLLLAGTDDLEPSVRQQVLASVRATIESDLGGVSIPLPSRFTFTSRAGTIPLQIVSDADRLLVVRVSLDSPRLAFPEGDAVEVTLEPGINRVDIPVVSRTSGDSSLAVAVTSRDGSLLLAQGRVTIRSTALSGVGVTIAAAALLVLVVWWVRHHRRVRRVTRPLRRTGRGDYDPESVTERPRRRP